MKKKATKEMVEWVCRTLAEEPERWFTNSETDNGDILYHLPLGMVAGESGAIIESKITLIIGICGKLNGHYFKFFDRVRIKKAWKKWMGIVPDINKPHLEKTYAIEKEMGME